MNHRILPSALTLVLFVGFLAVPSSPLLAADGPPEVVPGMKARMDAALARLAGPAATAPELSDQEILGLEQKAFDLLRKRDLKAAIAAYEKVVAARPFDAMSIYNLACAESLAGHPDAALDRLEQAVRAGFRDADQIRSDPDLTSIRSSHRFAAILSSLTSPGESPAIDWCSDYGTALKKAREECALLFVLLAPRGDGNAKRLNALAGADPALADRLAATVPVRIDIADHAEELKGAGLVAPAIWIVSPESGWLVTLPGTAKDAEIRAELRQAATYRPAPSLGKKVLTPAVRRFLAAKLFPGLSPDDPAIAKATQILQVPETILEEIGRTSWVRHQLRVFGTAQLFCLVTPPDGKTRAVHFRNGKCRQMRVVSPAVVRVLHRLYAAKGFAAPPAAELEKWRQKKKLDPAAVLTAAIARIRDNKDFPLDASTIARAKENLEAAAQSGKQIATALGALGETKYGPQCTWAGIWLLSRLDRMRFERESHRGGIGDLDAMTDRIFFENVYYAVKARNVFPWGKDVSNEDFLQQVLSPRGTSEPLERWRALFFHALAPEVRELGAKDANKAVQFANECCYSFYQYEGNTTWEDFGMLTDLAVHEGRCEDCSNIQNAMIRALGLPAAQAFTPWWAHTDGNHAWTVVPSIDGAKSGNGRFAAKVYLKTWDGLTDITAKNAKVTVIETATKAPPGTRADLLAFNTGQWRALAHADVAGGKVRFKDVGCGRELVLAVKAGTDPMQLFLVGPDHDPMRLRNPAGTNDGPGAFPVTIGKSGPLGKLDPNGKYEVQVAAGNIWAEVPSKRTAAGTITFEGERDRLYRISGPKTRDRPFVVTAPKDDAAARVRLL